MHSFHPPYIGHILNFFCSTQSMGTDHGFVNSMRVLFLGHNRRQTAILSLGRVIKLLSRVRVLASQCSLTGAPSTVEAVSVGAG